ncbi:MAG: lytic transglycosylase domain-containing protein [bacterium]|nr:lytic transglycosylase domain-containing protein [bacterium]
MKKFCKHAIKNAIKIACLGILLVSVISCAPLYIESNSTASDTSVSVMSMAEEQQLARQVDEALFRAEAHVRAGQARLQENQFFEAYREFERARLLVAQEVDPKLGYANQVSVQGGIGILSTQMSGIMVRKIGIERGMGNLLESQENARKQTEKVDALRLQSQAVLQPINPPTSYYGPASSYNPQRSPARPGLRQLQTSDANRWSSFEEDIERNITILRRQREAFRQCLLRANSYFPRVISILADEGVPEFLAYMALLESGYQPEARSSSGKAGLWQLSSSIARQYGLHVGGSYDERLQVHASTRAFARYMSQLYRQSGNWVRAIAVFSPDRDYPARLNAARRIAENPRQYGFNVDLHNMAGRNDLLRRGTRSFFEPEFWGPPAY